MQANERPKSLPQINPKLRGSQIEKVIIKALEKDPEKRYQSCLDLNHALCSLQEATKFQTSIGSRGKLLFGLGALLVFIAAGLYSLSRSLPGQITLNQARLAVLEFTAERNDPAITATKIQPADCYTEAKQLDRAKAVLEMAADHNDPALLSARVRLADKYREARQIADASSIYESTYRTWARETTRSRWIDAVARTDLLLKMINLCQQTGPEDKVRQNRHEYLSIVNTLAKYPDSIDMQVYKRMYENCLANNQFELARNILERLRYAAEDLMKLGKYADAD